MGFWVALLLSLGYVVAAAVIGVGLAALALCVFVLPNLAADRLGPHVAAALATIALILAALWLSGCSLVVSYQRMDASNTPPPAEAPPDDSEPPAENP